jgi:hypothetical protein
MNAQNFVTFAQTNWTAIKQARQNQVTVTSNYGPTEAAEGIESEGFPTLPPYICYSWVDSATAATGAQYCGYGWPTDSDQQHRLAQAQADCVTEQASVVTVLTATLGDPDTIIATWSQIALSPLPLPSTASFTALTSETATFAPYIANTVSWATQDAASVDIWGAVGPTGRRTFLAPQFPSIFADPPSDFPPFEAGCTDSRGKSVFATLDYGTSGVLSHEDLAQILAQGTLVAGDPVGGDEYYFYDWPAPALPAARGRRGRPRPRPRPVADERIGARSDRRDGGGRARRSQSDQGDRC